MQQYKNLDCIMLIDDDDPTNYLHTLTIRKSLGTEVTIRPFNNAAEGLSYLTGEGAFAEGQNEPQPGIIFLDINMPGMNGWDFMEAYGQLRDEQKARVVVIMLTTSLNPADREVAEKNKDINAFLTKPLMPEMVHELAARFFPDDKG